MITLIFIKYTRSYGIKLTGVVLRFPLLSTLSLYLVPFGEVNITVETPIVTLPTPSGPVDVMLSPKFNSLAIPFLILLSITSNPAGRAVTLLS